MADVCFVVGILILIQVTGLQFNRLNVALSGQANQSQTYSDWTADRAVDGCKQADGDMLKCCSASLISPYTTGTDNYWMVDFGEAHLIYQIDVYYRTSIDQLSDFHVYVMLEEDEEQELTYTATINAVYNIPVNPVTSATGIIIRRQRNIISLCEVEAYECSDGYYGAGCHACGNCYNNSTCSKINGYCPHDCSPGWQNRLCNQACDSGTYGDNCTSTCGNCAGNEACNHVDGVCAGGCEDGWQGTTCHDVCSIDYYGPGCNSTCGQCAKALSCHHVNGECGADGCHSGWQGSTCHDACDSGTYGDNCTSTCGNCAGNEACNHVDGVCADGCEDGWQGTTCHDVCSIDYYGHGCNSTCGQCAKTLSCLHVNGECGADGCHSGWQGSTCHDACVSGSYGDNCTSTCGNCAGNEACNHVDGDCAGGCEDGWQGTTCHDACDSGTYGDDCTNTCGNCFGNDACNLIDGVCAGGCEDGWRGTTCHDAMTSASGDNTTAVVTGVLAAALLCIVVVLVGVIIWHRRRLRESKICDTEASKPNTDCVDFETKFMDIVTPNTTNRVEHNTTVAEATIYNNILPESTRRTIPVSDLRVYCWHNCSGAEHLYGDFKALPYGLQYGTIEANKLHNKQKNRLKDMYAYDKNRVQLPLKPGDPNSDYINASLITGYNQTTAYIASQGAMKSTVNDTWRMVWSQNVHIIVMLTACMENGMLKCNQYWPNDGAAKYGAISVRLVSEVARSEFTIREFLCKEADTRLTRQVIQYHYTAWPDKDVPDTPVSLVQFWNKVKHSKHADRTPWIVHCSAGVGRTGTFIALDYLYEQAKCEDQVSVFDCVNVLCTQRVNMVQTMGQYLFLHRAVLEAIAATCKCCPLENFQEQYRNLLNIPDGTKASKLQTEFEMFELEVTNDMKGQSKPTLDDLKSQEDNHASSKLRENRMKIRDDTVLPNDRFRPHLTSGVPGRNSFINATLLPGYTAGDRLIITQRPLANTVVDFVRLVWDYNVGTVVVMDRETQPDNEAEYWSGTADTGPFSVTVTHEVNVDSFRTRTIRIKHLGVVRECKQLEFTDWPRTGAVPGRTASILEFISQVETVHGGDTDSPIVVCCRNGAERSGLFCVLWVVLQRMKADREVAIAETIRIMRVRRQQIVPTYAQYKYCHDVINEYLETFEMYEVVT